jgi:transposase
MASPVYPSDLSDDEWTLLSPLIPEAKPGGRQLTKRLQALLLAVRPAFGLWRLAG